MATESLQLDRFLPYRLSVLTNTVSRALARRYEERFGLTIPQWRVVAVLGRESDLSASEVARRTVMDKVTVSRAVAGLLADARVLRETDPDDRRRTLLRLAPAGRSIYRRIVPLARTYERSLLRALDRDERAQLDHLLTRLTARAHDLQDRGRS
jgi:DNA-binding MarR family transcriptional regulator